MPSEHIYSDYPIKYKPKRSISPPPIDNRGLTTPTPPPSEPAPPIPDVIACGAAVRKPDVSEYCNSGKIITVVQNVNISISHTHTVVRSLKYLCL